MFRNFERLSLLTHGINLETTDVLVTYLDTADTARIVLAQERAAHEQMQSIILERETEVEPQPEIVKEIKNNLIVKKNSAIFDSFDTRQTTPATKKGHLVSRDDNGEIVTRFFTFIFLFLNIFQSIGTLRSTKIAEVLKCMGKTPSSKKVEDFLPLLFPTEDLYVCRARRKEKSRKMKQPRQTGENKSFYFLMSFFSVHQRKEEEDRLKILNQR